MKKIVSIRYSPEEIEVIKEKAKEKKMKLDEFQLNVSKNAEVKIKVNNEKNK